VVRLLVTDDVEVVELDDFRNFSLTAPPHASMEDIGRILLAAGLGEVDQTHAYIRLSALTRFIGDSATAQWAAGVEKMEAFASSRGWVGPGGGVRAHIDRELGQPRER
jgi:hypothetical protein